jgi:hypothetical protein
VPAQLPALDTLTLDGNPFTSVSELADSPSLKNLNLGQSAPGGFLGNLHLNHGLAVGMKHRERAQAAELFALKKKGVFVHFDISSPYPDQYYKYVLAPSPWDLVLGSD